VNDQHQKFIQIRADLLRQFPDLSSCTVELVWQYTSTDWHWLNFETAHRSVRLEFRGGDFPEAIFYWAKTEIFRNRAENGVAAGLLLNRWLIENAMPSALRIEFPTLHIGSLADYYEAGNPAEGEFIQSWDRTEKMNGLFRPNSRLPALIAELRHAGYDRKLRAGRDHGTLILSRSLFLFCFLYKPNVRFCVDETGETMDVVLRNLPGQNLNGIAVALTPEVKTILDRLANEPVDLNEFFERLPGSIESLPRGQVARPLS
jgi:hypothetical protein